MGPRQEESVGLGVDSKKDEAVLLWGKADRSENGIGYDGGESLEKVKVSFFIEHSFDQLCVHFAEDSILLLRKTMRGVHRRYLRFEEETRAICEEKLTLPEGR